jgi:heme-degrading monooxygenase HmoA
MQKILIDTFIVPETAMDELLSECRRSASIIRTLPGFVEGYIFEKVTGESTNNVVTTAVWESEEALANAQAAAKAAFQKIGFNPKEIIERLQVQMQRAIYDRSTY